MATTNSDDNKTQAAQKTSSEKSSASVNYGKTVTDANVKAVLDRVANHYQKDVSVVGGNRSQDANVKGGSATSLHFEGKAADFHVKGVPDAKVFNDIKQNPEKFFDKDKSYEVVRHGLHTNTEAPHVHIGRYDKDDKNYNANSVQVKTEGLTKETHGKYSVSVQKFSDKDTAKTEVKSPEKSGVLEQKLKELESSKERSAPQTQSKDSPAKGAEIER
jgi:Peptidase M15